MLSLSGKRTHLGENKTNTKTKKYRNEGRDFRTGDSYRNHKGFNQRDRGNRKKEWLRIKMGGGKKGKTHEGKTGWGQGG